MRTIGFGVLLSLIALSSLSRELFASTATIGRDGINSKVTTLTGEGATIGQVERLRPGDEQAFDDMAVHGVDDDAGPPHYGLAWWYGLAPDINEPVTGDFDSDSDVDGADLLSWQRGNSPNPLSAGDLADWQTNYGTGSLAATTTVPEPSYLTLLFSLALLHFRSHKRST